MAKKSTTNRTRRGTVKETAAQKSATTGRAGKKHVGDVLGISRARVPTEVPRATTDRGGRPKGVEIPRATRTRVKPAGTVGGVRGRGR